MTVETPASRAEHDDQDWAFDRITKRFSAHMMCTNSACGDGVVVSGSAYADIQHVDDGEGGFDAQIYDIYYPELVHPAPSVITMPPETPEPIKDEIKRASALIWADVSSSANKLRLTAERIVTALGVPKTKLVKHKRIPIVLSERINRLSQKRPEITDLLHSIRFLGNVASHESMEGVDRDDLLNAFEIIEHVAELAFSQKSKRVRTAAKSISRRKGRPRVPPLPF